MVGGIRTVEDVVKYLLAGAAAVQVCSLAVLQGQEVYGKLAAGLAAWMDTHGFRSVDDLRGLYRRENPPAGTDAVRTRDPAAPEASPHPAIDADRCDLCLACQRACIHRAILFADKTFQLDRTLCVSCGLCCTVCPRDALTMT